MSAESILCIETSGLNCGIALIVDKQIVSHYSHWMSNVHDRVLATMCQQLLQVHERKVSDLSAIAVSAGPGSFTGLRIGVSFAKALCFDNTPPLIALPTLEALAVSAAPMARLIGKDSITVVVPSQAGKYYCQVFSSDTSALDNPSLLTTSHVRDLIHEKTMVVGSAAKEFSSTEIASVYTQLSADLLAPLALRLFESGSFVNAQSFVPLYVQDFVPRTQGV